MFTGFFLCRFVLYEPLHFKIFHLSLILGNSCLCSFKYPFTWHCFSLFSMTHMNVDYSNSTITSLIKFSFIFPKTLFLLNAFTDSFTLIFQLTNSFFNCIYSSVTPCIELFISNLIFLLQYFHLVGYTM